MLRRHLYYPSHHQSSSLLLLAKATVGLTSSSSSTSEIISTFRFRSSGKRPGTRPGPTNRVDEEAMLNKTPNLGGEPTKGGNIASPFKANPNDDPMMMFKGQKGMYHESELTQKAAEAAAEKGKLEEGVDLEDEQYKKYYSGGAGGAGSRRDLENMEFPSSQQQKQQQQQQQSARSKTVNDKQTLNQHVQSSFTTESPFGMRRRAFEHAEAEEAEQEIDVVRTEPFARRKVAQSHYLHTKPHGAHFEKMESTPEPVHAPAEKMGDEAKVPPAGIRFFAFPKRFIWESIHWAPETVVTTGKYKVDPLVAKAQLEKRNREWANLQEKDKFGHGNFYFEKGKDGAPVENKAEEDNDGAFTGEKKIEQIDHETEQMQCITLSEFTFKAGMNSFLFFFIFFFFFSMMV